MFASAVLAETSRDLDGVLLGVLDAMVWNFCLFEGVLLIPPSLKPGMPLAGMASRQDARTGRGG